MLIVEKLLTQKISTINTINFQSKLIVIIVSDFIPSLLWLPETYVFLICLCRYQAQRVAFKRDPPIVLIWINLGGYKHHAALSSVAMVAMCEYCHAVRLYYVKKNSLGSNPSSNREDLVFYEQNRHYYHALSQQSASVRS